MATLAKGRLTGGDMTSTESSESRRKAPFEANPPYPGSVAAAVCTYRRPAMLRECLNALCAQTREINEIVVVDNAAADATAETLSGLARPVTLLSMQENVGPAGGFAEAMRYCYEAGHDWIWLFNDDTAPFPIALERCIDATVFLDGKPGVVAANALEDGTGDPALSSWFTMNGALLHRDVISEIGLPRADFFMCFEEHEYSMRMEQAGLPVFRLPELLVPHVAAGSAGSSPPWRGYYQTRNELLAAIALRSPRRASRWALRQAKFVIAAVLYLDRKWERVRLRAFGAWHGARGISGRTITPDVTGGS